jgi:hypothetical protein
MVELLQIKINASG